MDLQAAQPSSGPQCWWLSRSFHWEPATRRGVQRGAGVLTPPHHPRSFSRCSSKLQRLRGQHIPQAVQAGRQQAHYSDPDWLLLARSLSGRPLAARRDSPRSEPNAGKDVEQFPEGAPACRSACARAAAHCCNRSAARCCSWTCRARQQDMELGTDRGRRQRLPSCPLPRSRMVQQCRAVPGGRDGLSKRGPRTASRAPQPPRGHTAVPPPRAAARLCPARLICVTATTSPLRSSRSLMLMTVNMKQRP